MKNKENNKITLRKVEEWVNNRSYQTLNNLKTKIVRRIKLLSQPIVENRFNTIPLKKRQDILSDLLINTQSNKKKKEDGK